LRVLLDSCIWPGAKRGIAGAGHQVEWVGDWESDPGDADILAHAARHAQTIVTLDKDFGELVVALGHAHAGIVRLVLRAVLNHCSVGVHGMNCSASAGGCSDGQHPQSAIGRQ